MDVTKLMHLVRDIGLDPDYDEDDGAIDVFAPDGSLLRLHDDLGKIRLIAVYNYGENAAEVSDIATFDSEEQAAFGLRVEYNRMTKVLAMLERMEMEDNA